MTSRRVARLAEAIRESVSTSILFNLRDPRVKNVTVIRAEVASDLRSAKVYVSVMGDEKAKALSIQGLNSARGFIQSKVADRVETRYTPVLEFVLDEKAVESVNEANRILEELARERAEHGDATAPDSTETAESAE